MSRLAKCTVNENRERNLRRNLHQLVAKHGRQLNIQISHVKCRVKNYRKGKVRTETVSWPVIHLSQWMHCMLAQGGELLLAGHNVSKTDGWQRVFNQFWKEYQLVDPSHPIYHDVEESLHRNFIPYTLHGDEGRGRNKTPVLIESFCPVVSYKGVEYTNIKSLFVEKYINACWIVSAVYIPESIPVWIWSFWA